MALKVIYNLSVLFFCCYLPVNKFLQIGGGGGVLPLIISDAGDGSRALSVLTPLDLRAILRAISSVLRIFSKLQFVQVRTRTSFLAQAATLTLQEFTASQCSCQLIGKKAEPEFKGIVKFSKNRK